MEKPSYLRKISGHRLDFFPLAPDLGQIPGKKILQKSSSKISSKKREKNVEADGRWPAIAGTATKRADSSYCSLGAGSRPAVLAFLEHPAGLVAWAHAPRQAETRTPAARKLVAVQAA